MARTKQKARKSASKAALEERKAAKDAAAPQQAGQAEAGPSTPVTAASLIDKAHVLIAQSNFELAIQFLQRALELEPQNLEAKELIGIAELEGGDPEAGRQYLLQLFPPQTASPPTSPSPYLYLAQSAEDPHEALGYYSAAAVMLEKQLSSANGNTSVEASVEEQRSMAVTCLVAMIEIWMSDLCFEEAAEKNCDDLISRALSIAPNDFEVRLSLASIRMSQQRTEEAKAVAVNLFDELETKEPFEATMPPLPTRLTLVRLLLEHSLHLPALALLATAREEDSEEVESAYLEGWSYHLRAEAIEADPSIVKQTNGNMEVNRESEEEQGGLETMNAEECYAESMRALLECAQLFTQQEYPDEGIGAHAAELLEGLEKKGVKPAIEEEDDEEGGDWEDVNGQESKDVDME